MSTINVEMIDKLKEQIEGITKYADNICANLNEKIKNKQPDEAQEIVDEKVDELSDEITKKGSKIKDKIVDTFKAQFASAKEKIKPIEPLLELNPSPDTIVDIVKLIIEIITSPYQPIIDFTTEIIPKVSELSEELQKLSDYKPEIEAPEGVTVPSPSINIEPISAGDITGGESK